MIIKMSSRLYHYGLYAYTTTDNAFLILLTLELLIYFDPFSIFVGIVLKLTPIDCVTNTFLGLRFIFKLKYEKSAIVVHVLQKR